MTKWPVQKPTHITTQKVYDNLSSSSLLYHSHFDDYLYHNLLTAITSRVATLISASSKDHVTIEYHVMCLVFCMYSTLYAVQYGEVLLS